MSDILRPRFGRTLPSPQSWNEFPDLFAEHLTTPLEVTQDMAEGARRALSAAKFCLKAAEIPVYYETELRIEHAAGRLSVRPDDMDENDEGSFFGGLITRSEVDLSREYSRLSFFSVAINPRAVFRLSDELMHVVYPENAVDRRDTRVSATEALTYVGLGHYINQLAGRKQDEEIRRNAVLSTSSAHGASTMRHIDEFPVYEDFAGALLGGTLYSAWLYNYLRVENSWLTREVADIFDADLRSKEVWHGETLLDYALSEGLSSEEVSKLLQK